MADPNADIYQHDGSEVAHNPDVVNFTDGIDVSESEGVVEVKLGDNEVSQAKTIITQSVTATDDGTGTGTIDDDTTFATIDADSDANHIVVLPTPTVGRVVRMAESGTTGFELRSSAPASVGINAGTGTNAESAIAGVITLVECRCVSATNWVCSQYDADGDESKVEQAA